MGGCWNRKALLRWTSVHCNYLVDIMAVFKCALMMNSDVVNAAIGSDMQSRMCQRRTVRCTVSMRLRPAVHGTFLWRRPARFLYTSVSRLSFIATILSCQFVAAHQCVTNPSLPRSTVHAETFSTSAWKKQLQLECLPGNAVIAPF